MPCRSVDLHVLRTPVTTIACSMNKAGTRLQTSTAQPRIAPCLTPSEPLALLDSRRACCYLRQRVLQMCRADVSTYCFGLAASMGAFLLTAGTKGKRFSMPNARIMIHQPLGGASGQAVDIEIQAKEIMYHKANLNGIMAECTGQPIEQVSIQQLRPAPSHSCIFTLHSLSLSSLKSALSTLHSQLWHIKEVYMHPGSSQSGLHVDLLYMLHSLLRPVVSATET